MKDTITILVLFFAQCQANSGLLESVLLLPNDSFANQHQFKKYHIQDIATAKDGPLEEFQVIDGILSPSEIKYYSKTARNAVAADRKMIGRFQAPAPLVGNLTQRIQLLSDAPGVCTESSNENEPTMVKITRLNRGIPGHTDILAEDNSPMSDHVFFIFLNTNHDAAFIWGDYKIPVIANTAMVFRGNTTHQVTVEDGEVEFLGPVGLDSFEEIGYGCTGQTVEVACFSGTTSPVTQIIDKIDIRNGMEQTCNEFEITIACDEAFTSNRICFDCVGDAFSFYTEGSDFFSTVPNCVTDCVTACAGDIACRSSCQGQCNELTSFGDFGQNARFISGFNSRVDGTQCNLEKDSSSVPSLTETCRDGAGNEITLTIVNKDKMQELTEEPTLAPVVLQDCPKTKSDCKKNKIKVCLREVDDDDDDDESDEDDSKKPKMKMGNKKNEKSLKGSKRLLKETFKTKCVDPDKDLKGEFVGCGCCPGETGGKFDC